MTDDTALELELVQKIITALGLEATITEKEIVLAREVNNSMMGRVTHLLEFAGFRVADWYLDDAGRPVINYKFPE